MEETKQEIKFPSWSLSVYRAWVPVRIRPAEKETETRKTKKQKKTHNARHRMGRPRESCRSLSFLLPSWRLVRKA